MTRYMVIEKFRRGCRDAVYERFRIKGRMMPAGLVYLDSWLEKNGNRCFQLMETNDSRLFQEWTRNWADLMEYEIVEIGEKPGS